MKKNKRTFQNDDELIKFMEAHDGFELADQGFAEIIETPVFSRKDKKSDQAESGDVEIDR